MTPACDTRANRSISRDRVRILSADVDSLTLDQAADRVMEFVMDGAQHQVVTVNPEFVMLARRNPRFRRALRQADLATADGVGIVLAARLFGARLPERIGGIDLWIRIAERARDQQRSLYMLGAAPGVAEAAAAQLVHRFPGLVVAGTYAGSPHPREAAQIVDRIRAARPSILGVAYGAPEQDIWIAKHLQQLEVPVAIGLGGAFDFLAGVVPRAPLWIRSAGLEWLFRLVMQPWRWRRMLALPAFAALVFMHTPLERLARRR